MILIPALRGDPEVVRDWTGALRYYLTWLIGAALPLAPFGIALACTRRDVRRRVLIAMSPGLLVGLVFSILLFRGINPYSGGYYLVIGIILWMGACVLGALFGLVALVSLGPVHRQRWSLGDAQGRVLALLGLAPAILFVLGAIVNAIANFNVRNVAPWCSGIATAERKSRKGPTTAMGGGIRKARRRGPIQRGSFR
jgi:hypothetical protein